MRIKKWIIDEVYCDDLRGDDSFGHWEEIYLDREQVKEAVKTYLWSLISSTTAPNESALQKLFDDINERVDIEEAYAEEIAEYFGGRAC